MQNNFSYPLKLEDISSATKHYDISASSAELKCISEILQLPAVKYFSASLDVRADKPNHLIEVKGSLNSVVEQISVITLEHFDKKYQINFERLFDTKLTLAQQREMEEFTDINADIPDIIEDNQIDIKAIALEALALELDDFPRQKNEVFSFTPDYNIDEDKPQNPFAILEKLKK